MEVGSNGSIVKKYVLRKKPAGKLLASAHAVEREFQVCIFNPNLLWYKLRDSGLEWFSDDFWMLTSFGFEKVVGIEWDMFG